MYWNLFVRPLRTITDKVHVCVTAFEAHDEELVRTLFYKRHIGLEIITTSSHPTRELAYKQIYAMGDTVKSHFEFWEKTMVCSQCGLAGIGSMSDAALCDFCHLENEHERMYPAGSPR